MKRKLFITLLSLLCASGFVLGGCGGCNDGEGDSSGGAPIEEEKVVTLADFETWETGMQRVRTGQYFGAMRENENAEYVKSGKKSLQIHPLGGYRTGSAPIFFITTKSELLDFDYSNFSKAEKITFEFYNAEEEEIPVAVGLITSLSGVDMFQTTSIEYQNLSVGWNTVTYEVNLSALAISTDVENIEGVYVAFENAHSLEEEDAPDIYMDDVKLHRFDEAPAIENLVVLDENEYINFEKDWQKYVVGVKNTAYAPDIEIGKASDYTVGEAGDVRLDQTADCKVSGEKVLRVVAKNGQQPSATYPGVEFASALLKRSFFAKMEERDYGRTTFAFDVYNNSAKTMRLGVSFYTNDGRNRKEYGVDLLPYEWTNFSVLMKDLYYDFMASNKNSTKLFSDPGIVAFYWPEFTDGDKELFFDNFRYEVEEIDVNAKPTVTLTPFVRVAQDGDKIELPLAKVTDKYDLKLDAKMSVLEKNSSGEWVDVTLVDGLIPIKKGVEYKIVASAVNSLKNETVVEYFFKGVEKVEQRLWASYDYADEVDNVYVVDRGGEDKKSWLESVTLNGETKEGVVKVETDNADPYGSGYLGFQFGKEGLDDAADAKWDYFTVSVYIEASVPTVDIYSLWAPLAKNVPTNCWTEIVIRKDDLNSEVTKNNPLGDKSWVNTSQHRPMTDGMFYEAFGEVCGTNVSELFFIKDVTNRSSDSCVTYYIDKVTWGTDKTEYPDLDDYAPDIYA